MAEEKILTVNLRGKILKVPRWKRSKGAMKVLREMLEKQVKVERIVIDKSINEKIWSRSIQNPITKLKIKITTDEKTARAELVK